MAMSVSAWGNALHTGEKSYNIVHRRLLWLTISLVALTVSVGLLVSKGIVPGLEFTGGSQFTLSVGGTPETAPAVDVVEALVPDPGLEVTTPGGHSIQVRMVEVSSDTSNQIVTGLAEAYGVRAVDVGATVIGPSWGQDVSSKALKGLTIFVILVSLFIASYFRAWRMAAAALVALAHDLAFTVGIYAGLGFEITPASVIGFLTILGYSLYDTVIVFDKVRENTANVTSQNRYTYAELANLAVNQTLVRSINTSVIALLPVSAILFVGSLLLGAGTLTDISLALFVGMAIGTYSSIFVATPLEVWLREREPRIKKHTEAVLAARAAGVGVVDSEGRVRVGASVKGEHKGVAAQPKRKHRP